MAASQFGSAPLSFGIFDQVEWEDRPAGEVFEEHLRLVEYADDAGFYCYHVSEHHGTSLSLDTSPGILLAAASQRTKRIRLGPLVLALPYYNPYRLANEISMLDHLSGGRIEIGLGRGVSPLEAVYFGVKNVEDSRAIYRESFDILLSAFTSDVLNYDGEHFTYSDIPLWISPVQKPYPPLWFPSSNEESIPFTSKHGLNTVLNNTFTKEAIADLSAKYKVQLEEHRGDPDRMNGHVAIPKIGLSVKVVLTPSDAEAERIARPAFATWAEHIAYLNQRSGASYRAERGDYDGQRSNSTLLVGSPERVSDEAAALVAETGINYLLCSFAFGDLAHEHAMRSMHLFAERVMSGLADG